MEKRYYWIKLKDSFMESDSIDYLMSQKNGAEYVVLYQMLCLRTLNTGGALIRKIGQVIIPYDAAKIQRDCKYFSLDTVMVALELYKNLGLIFEDEDGSLKISNYDNLIGSEGSSAARVRAYREREALKNYESLQSNAVVTQNETILLLQSNAEGNANGNKIVTVDIRERDDSLLKSKEIKEKFRRMGAYIGDSERISSIIDEVAEVLAVACVENRTFRFKSVKYSSADFEKIVEKIDIECVCKVVNVLLQRDEEIEDRRYYILGVIVGEMKARKNR